MPVPATGTFAVYPSALVIVDANGFALATNSSDGTTPKDNAGAVAFLKAGGNRTLANANAGGSNPYVLPFRTATNGTPFAGTYELEMSPDTTAIIFNPGGGQQIVDILSGEFPSGFEATTLKVRLLFFAGNAFLGPTIYTDFLNLKYFSSTIKTFAEVKTAANFANPPIWYESDPTGILPAGTYFSANQTFKNFGFSITYGDAGGGITDDKGLIFAIEMTGSYRTASWTATVAVTPTQVSPGTVITLTEPAGRLTEINPCSFTVEYRDLAGVIQTIALPCSAETRISGFLMYLNLGNYIPYGGRLISLRATVTSASYSGTVTLATLNQLLVDGSGIYKMVKDKRQDTYWDRTNPLAPVKTDVKIPNPFIKTGFL